MVSQCQITTLVSDEKMIHKQNIESFHSAGLLMLQVLSLT